jgi:hypothetical protein
MSRGKVGGTDGAVLERSKPTKDLKASKEKALCVELREILKLPQYEPGELAEPPPRKKRERPSIWDIELSYWRARREELSPLLEKAAKSNIPPEEKGEFAQDLADAEGLSLDRDLKPAYQKLDELEARIKQALQEAEAAPEGKKRGEKKQRKKAAVEQQRAEKELLVEATLSALPPTIDLTKPRAILARHKTCVPEEGKVLDEFDTLDDLLNNKALKGDPDQMKEKLTAIGAAMKAAFARQKEMSLALAAIPKPSKTADAGMGFQDDEIRAYQEVTRISAGMIDHLPPSWIAQWTPNFSDRIANLTATDDEKQANLEEAKKGFAPETVEEHRQALGNAIGSNSTRKLDRVEFFFDRLTTAATKEELQALAKMQDEVIAVGTKILDSGGKLSDVKKALAHIPEAWWPPQFIDYLQAWRKTEREMVRLAVAKAFEKADKAETALDTVDGILSFVGFLGTAGTTITKIGNTASGGGDAGQPWTEATEIQKTIQGFVGQIQATLQLGRDGVGAMDKEFFSRENTVLEFFQSPEKMEEVSAKLLEITSTTASTVYTTAKNIGSLTGVPDTAALMTSVLPGIALAAASIDLYLAIRSLAKHARTLGSTKKLVKDAELDLAMEADEDGGGFVRALGNEVSARKLQLKKDSVDVTVKGIGVGAATAYTVGGHVGAGVGLGLAVTGKVVSYGGKVVFANIEWSQANVAKKLIKEARAGSPSARIELMSECGLYAKLYIAILARDGHKKATEFIVDRGIEESDLEGGPLALKIVVDEMLKDADQPDETKIEDNIVLANIAGVGGKGAINFARTVGKTGKSVGEWVEGKLDSNRETPYDEKWKHKSEHVALTATAWSAAKAEAKKAGLLDAPSGVGEDLKTLEAAYAKLQKADQSKPDELKNRTLAVLDSLDALYITLMDYEPLTNPQGPKEKLELHRGMYEYVSAMKTKVSTEQGKFDAALIAAGHKITDWSTKDTNPDPVEWKANFADCATKSYLSQDDHGVGKALVAFQAAETSPDMKNDKDKQKRREALVAAYDAGTAVLGALDVLYGSSRECQGLRVYIDNIKRTVAARMRFWDKESVTVVGENWKLPVKADLFTAAAWNTCWTQAVKDGMATAELKDGGLGHYLTKAEAANVTLANEQDAKKLMKARKELQQALASVFGASRACATAHKSSPAAFTQYATAYGKWAQGEIQKVRDSQAAVKFDVSDQAFNAESFEKIADRAKESGAVGSSGGTMKKVKEALASVAKAEEAFQKAAGKKDAKGQRKAAQERQSALLDLMTAAVDALSAEGYADNTQMREYLDGVKNQAAKQQEVAEYKSVLDGTATGFADFDPGNYSLDKAGWEKVKKSAVEAGVLPDSRTGFGAALEAADKSYKEWKDAEAGDKVKKATPAAAAVTSALKIAEQMSGATANKKLKEYFDKITDDLELKQSETLTNLASPFKPAAFSPWSKSAWKKVKAEAVVRGLLKKDDETGLADALAAVKEAVKAWGKLADAEKMAQRDSFQKPVIKVREIATTYRDATNDKGLKGYFSQMFAAANAQIDEMQKDRVGDKDLKLPTFNWSQKDWQAAKKLAVDAGVLKETDTGFGDALDKSHKAFDDFRKAQGKNDNKAIATARTKAEEQVEKARKIAADMSAGNTHSALKKYFDRAVLLAEGMLAELSQDEVQLNPPEFDWTNSAGWETTRKEAVKLKLLDEKASSKFGDELKDASSKYMAFGAALQEANAASQEKDEKVKKEKQAKALAKKLAVQEPARAALTKARQTAEALKKQTQHKKLQNYFNQCLLKADEWLNVVQL